MSSVRLELRADRIAVLTFDLPGSRANILSRQTWLDFEAALDPLAIRSDLSGLLLTSAKPGIFIAGADLKFLAGITAPNNPDVRELIELGLRVLGKLESLPFPTCAVIDGAALGGGLEVALACDHRLVGTHPKVELGLPEVKLGLIPGWGGTQRLPRIVGLDRALEMLTSGESLNAADAVAADLAGWQTDSDELLTAAVSQLADPDWRDLRESRHVAWSRAEIPSCESTTNPAIIAVIECVTQGISVPLSEGLKLETEAFVKLAGSPESRQAIAAFFAARTKA